MYTVDQVEAMDRKELRAAAKEAGIKYGKLSLMQIRDQLVGSKKPKKAKGERKERTGTKMLDALEIMTKNPNMPRKGIIAKFISDAKLTKAGANTYYSLCQKKLAAK